MKLKYIALILLMAQGILFSQENEELNWSASRPDGHAPISVMGDHVHHKGEWMFSYRFMTMNMENLRSGTSSLNNDFVFQDYMVSPQQMKMNMHMLGAMYAPSDKLTLMAMVSVLSSDMDLLSEMHGSFTTGSSGFGDLKIAGLYKFFDQNRQSLHAQLQVSLPTGSIDEEGVTPASMPIEMILPYPMQIGSGTFDTEPGITYLVQNDLFSFGSQLKGLLRFDKNDNNYRLGNRYQWENWLGFKTTDWLSISARIQGVISEKIKGKNPDLMPMMVTTANTQNSGGKLISSGLGANFFIPEGSFKNIRFGIEYSLPVYQDLNGIQLEQQRSWTFGLQYSFH